MAKAAVVTAAGALGLLAALEAPFGHADTPPATVTVTTTRAVRIEGRGIWWWRDRAIHNRRVANRALANVRHARRFLHARWTPTVRYALDLARAVYGYDQSHRAWCESRYDPFAAEGHGPVGLLQFVPSTFRSTPFGGFSIYDPVAQALAGGWMIRAGRSGEWSCGL